MYKNLKIQERLKKCFTVVALLASIAGVIGAIMMLIISTQYKHALTNYGFSQGDIGKAMIVFADARSAARGVIGYNDTDMIATMKQIHDEKKQKFDDYWAIVANTCVTGTEKDLYEQVNTLVQQYWDAEAQAMEIGASTDKEDSIKAQQMMNDTVDPLYEQVYSLTADLLDANVNEGDSLAARLSAISIIFLIVIVASIVSAFAQAMRMGSSIAKGIAVPLGALSDRFKRRKTSSVDSGCCISVLWAPERLTISPSSSGFSSIGQGRRWLWLKGWPLWYSLNSGCCRHSSRLLSWMFALE